MGNSASSRGDQAPQEADQAQELPSSSTTRSQKRGIDQVYYDANQNSTPEPVRRKKLRTTSEYMYTALFVNGENSDVTIRSLKKEWNLHKVYLKQASYFKSLYHSHWKEASMEVIDLQIPDSNIDIDALDVTFGSLYSEDILIVPAKVISILAAASLIQLEGLMQQCAEVMKETVCRENVNSYLKAASSYGQNDVCQMCMEWLQTNLMMKQCLSLLCELQPDLLADIILSPNLVVVQIEMDIYTMLKKWLYLQLNPDYSGDFKGLLAVADAYFHQQAESSDSVFLESEQGKPFVDVFQALRLQHIIKDFVSCREIERGRIIPGSWLLQQYRQQWLTMLRIEQNIEVGPKAFVAEEFETNCLRCGRLLLRDTDHCWRWNGYNFGLDLLVSYSSQGPRTITFRRNVRSQRCSSSVSLASARHFIFKVTVTSVDEKGRILMRKSTENTVLQLQKEQEHTVMNLYWESIPDQHGLSKHWKTYFPLIITATFQVVNNPQTPELSRSGHAISPFLLIKEPHTLGDVLSDQDDRDTVV